MKLPVFFFLLGIFSFSFQEAQGTPQGYTVWACQNPCYRYSETDRPSFDPSAFPYYGAIPENILPGVGVSLCAKGVRDVQEIASAECKGTYSNSSNPSVDSMLTLFPVYVDRLCNLTGQSCERKGTVKTEFTCVANCSKEGDSFQSYPIPFSYCSTNNREALVEGTKYFNNTEPVCASGYSLMPPDLYDYVATPLSHRCFSTGKMCSSGK
jgi:hypothetical protein